MSKEALEKYVVVLQRCFYVRTYAHMMNSGSPALGCAQNPFPPIGVSKSFPRGCSEGFCAFCGSAFTRNTEYQEFCQSLCGVQFQIRADRYFKERRETFVCHGLGGEVESLWVFRPWLSTRGAVRRSTSACRLRPTADRSRFGFKLRTHARRRSEDHFPHKTYDR